MDGDHDWVWADLYEGTFSDQGYYYLHNDYFLYYLDTASGAVTALCTKAGCLYAEEPNNRKWESCGAYMSKSAGRYTPMCFWNGNLYYIETVTGLYLHRSNAIGTERTVIGSLGSVYAKDQKMVSVLNWGMSEGLWYYQATVDSLVLDPETGSRIYQRELAYIARVDLASGKEETLIEDTENELTLCSVSKGGALFTAEKFVDTKDPNYLELLNNRTAAVKYWDGATGQVTTLFEKVSTRVEMVLDGKVFYETFGGGEVCTFTFDLLTGGANLTRY